jgi:hypothetical protein
LNFLVLSQVPIEGGRSAFLYASDKEIDQHAC